jgi:hypothetical protein
MLKGFRPGLLLPLPIDFPDYGRGLRGSSPRHVTMALQAMGQNPLYSPLFPRTPASESFTFGIPYLILAREEGWGKQLEQALGKGRETGKNCLPPPIS